MTLFRRAKKRAGLPMTGRGALTSPMSRNGGLVRQVLRSQSLNRSISPGAQKLLSRRAIRRRWSAYAVRRPESLRSHRL